MTVPSDIIARLLGAWSLELNTYSATLRLSLSVLLSAVIGWERASKRHSAGLRTFMVVTFAGTVAMMLDILLNTVFGGTLFLLSAASVVSATIIAANSLFFSSRNQIRGITTSGALWGCCLLGLAVGAGFYTLSLAGTFTLL